MRKRKRSTSKIKRKIVTVDELPDRVLKDEKYLFDIEKYEGTFELSDLPRYEQGEIFDCGSYVVTQIVFIYLKNIWRRNCRFKFATNERRN